MKLAKSATGRGTLRFFCGTWLLLAVAAAMWSLATPLFASPDEDAQVVKAVAVAHGELLGETREQPGQYFPIITAVRVPAYYGTARATTDCYIWKTQQSAACAPSFTARDTSTREVLTWIGRYPPLYYAVVGVPSRFLAGTAAVLTMRVVSAVFCSALLAVGLTALRSSAHPAAFTAAGLLAVTPTTLFFAGMVNPTGLEVAAGFATWSLLLPLVLAPEEHRVRARLVSGAVTAVILVNSRPGSALLALLIAAGLAVVASRNFWREATRAGRWRGPIAMVVAGAAAAGAWLLVADPTASLGGNPDPALASPTAAFTQALGRTGRYTEEELGVFGWLNLPVHPLILLVLGGGIGLLLVAALVFARGRLRWGLVAVLVLVVLVPAVAQIPSAARLGLIWQGRYGLPLAVGLPVLAMAGLLAAPRARAAATAAAPFLLAVAVAGQVGAFAWSAWRYCYGFGHSPFHGTPTWQPPGGLAVCAGCFLVAMVALAAVLGLQAGSPLHRWLRRQPVTPRHEAVSA